MKKLFYLACAGFLALIWQFSPASSPQATRDPRAPPPLPLLIEKGEESAEWVGISIANWKQTSDGGVATFVFRLRNRSDFDVKDITVRCDWVAKSGAALGSKTLIVYEVLKKGADRRSGEIIFGFTPYQTSSATCLAQSAKRA